MKYIVFKDFNGKPVSDKINLPIVRGTELVSVGNNIMLDGNIVCKVGSLNALKYIALNEDGNGLERGSITYDIAYGDRVKYWTEIVKDEDGNERVENHSARFNNEEWQMIQNDYPDFLTKDGMMFSNAFFDASIERLRELYQKLS